VDGRERSPTALIGAIVSAPLIGGKQHQSKMQRTEKPLRKSLSLRVMSKSPLLR